MAKFSVTFPNIHCNQITTPRECSDQVYFVAIPTLISKAKDGEDPKKIELPAVISEWNPGVQPGNNYLPVLRDGRKEIVVDVPEDADKLVVAVALAERDNGATYEKLLSDAHAQYKPRPEWTEIKNVVPDDPTSITGWVKGVLGFLFSLVSAWIDDDLIATQSFEVDLTKPHGTAFQRFVGSGGDYIVNLEWRRLK